MISASEFSFVCMHYFWNGAFSGTFETLTDEQLLYWCVQLWCWLHSSRWPLHVGTAVCVRQGHSSCSLCVLLIGVWTVWLWGFSWSLPGTLRRQSREGSTWVLAKENAGSPPDPQPATKHEFGLWPQSPHCIEPHTEHTHTPPWTPPHPFLFFLFTPFLHSFHSTPFFTNRSA